MLQKLLRRAQGLHDKRANAFHRDHILDNEDLVKPASYAKGELVNSPGAALIPDWPRRPDGVVDVTRRRPPA